VTPPIEGRDSQVVLRDLGDSSVNWQVRVWCKTEDYWSIKENLTASIKKAFDNAKINIPFPQMDVHVENLSPVANG